MVGVGSFLGLYFFKEDVFDWKNGSGLQLENALAAIGSAGLL